MAALGIISLVDYVPLGVHFDDASVAASDPLLVDERPLGLSLRSSGENLTFSFALSVCIFFKKFNYKFQK